MTNNAKSIIDRLSTFIISNKIVLAIATIFTILGGFSETMQYLEKHRNINFGKMTNLLESISDVANVLYPFFVLWIVFIIISIRKKNDKIHDYLFSDEEGNLRHFIKRTITLHDNHFADANFLNAECLINRNAALSDSPHDRDIKQHNYRQAVIDLLHAINVEKRNAEIRNIKLFIDRLGEVLSVITLSDIKQIEVVNKLDIINIMTELEGTPIYKSIAVEIKGIKQQVFRISNSKTR